MQERCRWLVIALVSLRQQSRSLLLSAGINDLGRHKVVTELHSPYNYSAIRADSGEQCMGNAIVNIVLCMFTLYPWTLFDTPWQGCLRKKAHSGQP